MYLLIEDKLNTNYQSLYQNLKNDKFLAIDTEFERRNTYFATPSLIQIAGENYTYIIDLLKIEDYQPIKKLFSNSDIVKVMHCGFQDLEILDRLGIEINHCFDTQIAMRFLDMDIGLGFESMILNILDRKLNKAQQCSNWMLRPLTEDQLSYAAQDVIFLRRAYTKLKQELLKFPHLYRWCLEDCNASLHKQEDKQQSIFKPFCKVEPQLKQLKDKIKAFHIVSYRELRAIAENRSRRHIIRDENIARMIEKSMIPKAIRDYIGTSSDEDAMKAIKYSRSQRMRLNEEELKKSELLVRDIKKLGQKYGIPSNLIASQKDIMRYIKGNSSKLDSGWRNLVLKEHQESE